LDTEARARTAWLIFDASSDRLVSARRSVKAAEVNVSAVRESVKAGTARYTDLLLALAQRSRAQRVSADATFLYAKSWVELELASGALPHLVVQSLSSVLHTK
jgi:outer membrane protein TolC